MKLGTLVAVAVVLTAGYLLDEAAAGALKNSVQTTITKQTVRTAESPQKPGLPVTSTKTSVKQTSKGSPQVPLKSPIEVVDEEESDASVEEPDMSASVKTSATLETTGKTETTRKPGTIGKPETTGKLVKTEITTKEVKTEKPEKTEKLEKLEKTEKPPKQEKPDKVEKVIKLGHSATVGKEASGTEGQAEVNSESDNVDNKDASAASVPNVKVKATSSVKAAPPPPPPKTTHPPKPTTSPKLVQAPKAKTVKVQVDQTTNADGASVTNTVVKKG